MSSFASNFVPEPSVGPARPPAFHHRHRGRRRFWPASLYKKTVTAFVRDLPVSQLEAAFCDLPAPLVVDRPVSGATAGPVDFHGLGTAFHEAFSANVSGKWIALELYRYVRTLRSELARLGVDEIYTEWSHQRSIQSWRGEVDASLSRGPKPYGALELKVVGQEPGTGFADDLCQLACYCRLAAESGRPISKQFAVLAYFMPRHLNMRLLVWTDVAPLVTPLAALAD